ncbi:MAG TPA: glutathione S-transferase N-terminal domain-containing protein [Rhodopila sp.]|nr:glutathione S-transferase N-terminal domain-containing protein [Rhodopila sp.]
MLRLISASPSPYARKVRIALAEKGIPFTLQTEVPWDSSTETPRYNPLEKLPVLILDDGPAIYESRFILEYLEAKYPAPPLLPDDIDGKLAARQVEVLCDGICDACVLIFWERHRAAEHQSQEWIARQMRKVNGGLSAVARIAGSREWVVGDRFGLADIAVGTLLGYLSVRFAELPWRSQHPNLGALSDRLEQRPSFVDSKPYPQTITDKVV